MNGYEAAARKELLDVAGERTEEAMLLRHTLARSYMDVYLWSRRRLDRELQGATSAEQKAAAAEAHFKRMDDLARDSFWDNVERTEYFLTEAELLAARYELKPMHRNVILERQRLHGTWQLVTEERDGIAQSPRERNTLVFAGRRFSSNGTVIDPSREPRVLDRYSRSEDTSSHYQGIYKLDGDRLTICWNDGGTFDRPLDRPKEFVTRAGDRSVVWILQRVKDAKTK